VRAPLRMDIVWSNTGRSQSSLDAHAASRGTTPYVMRTHRSYMTYPCTRWDLVVLADAQAFGNPTVPNTRAARSKSRWRWSTPARYRIDTKPPRGSGVWDLPRELERCRGSAHSGASHLAAEFQWAGLPGKCHESGSHRPIRLQPPRLDVLPLARDSDAGSAGKGIVARRSRECEILFRVRDLGGSARPVRGPGARRSVLAVTSRGRSGFAGASRSGLRAGDDVACLARG